MNIYFYMKKTNILRFFYINIATNAREVPPEPVKIDRLRNITDTSIRYTA
jgi:hypothetical protein